MRFSLKKNELVNRLNIVNRAISGKVMIPILSGIKISAQSNGLTLIGSNSEISIKTIIAADQKNDLKIEEEGEIVVSANFFTSIIKRLSESDLQIYTEGSQIKISSGQSLFTVSGQAADNYPQLPRIDDALNIKIPADQLTDLIAETIKSVSAQDSRPLLTGIHFVIDQNQIKVVSTDSHRLAQRIVTLKSDSPLTTDVVVPSKALTELRALIEGIKEVDLQFDESRLMVNLGDTVFYSRLLEGQYPQTDRLIPQESTSSFSIDSQVLSASLDRASLVAHQSGNLVAQFTISNGSLEISTERSEIGNVHESLPIKNFQGKDLKISFNPDFVKDALSSISEKTLNFSFTSSLRPFVIGPAEGQGNEKIQLITPVRTF
ncbi:DNA polymerase III subunit beta [Oenococcus alcoholitolerans]|uniref:DNA polymerase III subunit beta n=1 Tax=Oenococcus alcoholitolerans TaxID=931074 RepID=UPI003F71D9A7